MGFCCLNVALWCRLRCLRCLQVSHQPHIAQTRAVWSHHHWFCCLDPFSHLLWASYYFCGAVLCLSRYIGGQKGQCFYFLCPRHRSPTALLIAEAFCFGVSWRAVLEKQSWFLSHASEKGTCLLSWQLPPISVLSQNCLVTYPLVGTACKSCLWLYESTVIELFRNKVDHKDRKRQIIVWR